jgi:hypothetical protein
MAEGNISGIFNYCDRWCERCTFTSRCAVYEDESEVSSEERDMKNKAFWDRLGQNFLKAKDLLQKVAEESGVDLQTIQVEMQEKERKKERIKHESREHPLSQLTFKYSATGREWLKTQPGMLDRLDALKTELTLGVESQEGARKQTITIKDSLAVIQWYLAFIHVKLVRALMGKMSSEPSEREDDYPRDYDGSAKIALIAIERSIHAWSQLFEILPDKEDDFLEILSMLQKIKTMTQEEFPGALAFVRPGFDEA